MNNTNRNLDLSNLHNVDSNWIWEDDLITFVDGAPTEENNPMETEIDAWIPVNMDDCSDD